MNKPLLIVLLLILAGLAVYMFVREKPDDRAELSEEDEKPVGFFEVPENAVLTDEIPEFQVQVTPKTDGPKQIVEFSITEAHGWAVKAVYVRAWYGEPNEETGEWEPKMARPVELLCREILGLGKTLVASTPLTEADRNNLAGKFGTAENWRGEVYKWGKVYKPGS